MKLENQVVSLELAKQLKEAGYPQEGLWWWNTHYDDGHWLHRFGDGFDEMMVISSDKRNSMLKNYDIKDYRTYREYSAPTVAELGVRLPNGYHSGNSSTNAKQKFCCFEMHYSPELKCYGFDKRNVLFEANTEANARAKMWLYLKKEGLLK